jgi:hypothetical protein
MMPMRSRSFVQSLVCLGLALSVGVLSDRAAAGPLSPPAGAVASSGKTLTEISPETAINPSTSPTAAGAMIRISQPGSYYLTGNVVINTPGFAGIEIAAPDVTLDMRGFRVVGNPSSGPGIGGQGVAAGFKLRNGIITNTGGIGLSLASVENVSVDNVRVQFAGSTAMQLGVGATLTNSQAISCQTGISAEAGSSISNCVARNNTGVGFTTNTACVITNCVATGNVTGFLLVQGTSAEGCTAANNSSIGFQSNSLAIFTRCTARGNGLHGFSVAEGSRLFACYAAVNGQDGFRIDRATRITECQSFFNGTSGTGAGIRAIRNGNTIESNSVNDNVTGIAIEGSPNLFVRNSAVGNTGVNFNVVAGNRGNIVIGFSGAATQGSQGGAQVSTDPNANITY